MSFFIIVLTFFYSCSLPTKFIKNYQNVKLITDEGLIIKLLISDFEFIKKNKLDKHFPFFHAIKEIHYSKKNCSLDQIACVFPNQKDKIFLTKTYLDIDQVDRVSTLLHEASHHIFSYHHVPCESHLISNVDCDETINSPFGQELLLLEFLYKQNKIDKKVFLQKRKLIIHRINNLSKS